MTRPGSLHGIFVAGAALAVAAGTAGAALQSYTIVNNFITGTITNANVNGTSTEAFQYVLALFRGPAANTLPGINGGLPATWAPVGKRYASESASVVENVQSQNMNGRSGDCMILTTTVGRWHVQTPQAAGAVCNTPPGMTAEAARIQSIDVCGDFHANQFYGATNLKLSFGYTTPLPGIANYATRISSQFDVGNQSSFRADVGCYSINWLTPPPTTNPGDGLLFFGLVPVPPSSGSQFYGLESLSGHLDRIDAVIETPTSTFVQTLATPNSDIEIGGLSSANPVTVAIASTPPGVVTELRLVFGDDHLMAQIGAQTIPIKVPSGAASGLKIVPPSGVQGFEVFAGSSTEIAATFDPTQLIDSNPGIGLHMKPVLVAAPVPPGTFSE